MRLAEYRPESPCLLYRQVRLRLSGRQPEPVITSALLASAPAADDALWSLLQPVTSYDSRYALVPPFGFQLLRRNVPSNACVVRSSNSICTIDVRRRRVGVEDHQVTVDCDCDGVQQDGANRLFSDRAMTSSIRFVFAFGIVIVGEARRARRHVGRVDLRGMTPSRPPRTTPVRQQLQPDHAFLV